MKFKLLFWPSAAQFTGWRPRLNRTHYALGQAVSPSQLCQLFRCAPRSSQQLRSRAGHPEPGAAPGSGRCGGPGTGTAGMRERPALSGLAARHRDRPERPPTPAPLSAASRARGVPSAPTRSPPLPPQPRQVRPGPARPLTPPGPLLPSPPPQPPARPLRGTAAGPVRRRGAGRSSYLRFLPAVPTCGSCGGRQRQAERGEQRRRRRSAHGSGPRERAAAPAPPPRGSAVTGPPPGEWREIPGHRRPTPNMNMEPGAPAARPPRPGRTPARPACPLLRGKGCASGRPAKRLLALLKGRSCSCKESPGRSGDSPAVPPPGSGGSAASAAAAPAHGSHPQPAPDRAPAAKLPQRSLPTVPTVQKGENWTTPSFFLLLLPFPTGHVYVCGAN